MSRRFSLFGACLLCLLLSACGGRSTRPDVVQPDVPEAVRVTPLETPGVFPVSEAEAQRLSRGLAPARQGMRSWKDMRFAVEQSLAYVRAKPSSRVAVNYPALQVTYGEMEKGLERLLRLLPFLDKGGKTHQQGVHPFVHHWHKTRAFFACVLVLWGGSGEAGSVQPGGRVDIRAP